MKRLIVAAAAASLLVASPALAFDWSGPYAGVIAGFSSGESTGAYDDPQLEDFDIDSSPSGWMIGVDAGFNQPMSGIVVGVEGDLSLSDITDTIDDELGNFLNHPGGPHSITSKTDFSGTLRGRLGFDAGDFMPYLTAGLAVAHATVNATDGDLEDDATLFGWTAGAGVEFAASDKMTIKVEALFTDLGDHTWFDGEDYSSTAHSTSGAVRVGLNFALD